MIVQGVDMSQLWNWKRKDTYSSKTSTAAYIFNSYPELLSSSSQVLCWHVTHCNGSTKKRDGYYHFYLIKMCQTEQHTSIIQLLQHECQRECGRVYASKR